MVQAGMTCIKYILAVFNFVFVIFGILLVVFGARSFTEAGSFKAVVESPDSLAITCVIVGSLLVIVAFLGCCGALRESQCMLVSFSVILFLFFVVEAAIAGVTFVYKADMKSIVRQRLNETLYEYNFDDDNATLTVTFNEVQSRLECCGINNYTDWVNAFDKLPESCCPGFKMTATLAPDALDTKCTTDTAFPEGCLEKVVSTSMNIYGPIALTAITLSVIQLLGVIFACCLTYAVKKEYQVV